jgi:hypothetical protein
MKFIIKNDYHFRNFNFTFSVWILMRYLLILLLVSCADMQTPSRQVIKQTVEIKETTTTTYEIYYQ